MKVIAALLVLAMFVPRSIGALDVIVITHLFGHEQGVGKGVTIFLTSEDGDVREGVTSQNSDYNFSLLPFGKYHASAEVPFFTCEDDTDVEKSQDFLILNCYFHLSMPFLEVE